MAAARGAAGRSAAAHLASAGLASPVLSPAVLASAGLCSAGARAARPLPAPRLALLARRVYHRRARRLPAAGRGSARGVGQRAVVDEADDALRGERPAELVGVDREVRQ